MIHNQARYRPLENHAVFSSSDIEEVIETVAMSYCPHKLALIHGDTTLDACHNRVTLASSSLNYLQYGAEVAINPGAFEKFFMLEFPLSGAVDLRYGHDRFLSAPGRASLLSPTKPVRSIWSPECAQVMVKISRAAMEGHLAELIGASLKEPLEFHPVINLSGPEGGALRDYVACLLSLVDHNSRALSVSHSARAMEESLITLLLTCQEHNYAQAVRRAGQGPAVPRHVARAKAYIDDNLAGALSVPAIAASCGVSERALYKGFKRFLGITPASYIKNQRLEKVRQSLLAAPAGAKITRIATDWGFLHLGRFAQDYQRRFGEKPSQTLRAS